MCVVRTTTSEIVHLVQIWIALLLALFALISRIIRMFANIGCAVAQHAGHMCFNRTDRREEELTKTRRSINLIKCNVCWRTVPSFRCAMFSVFCFRLLFPAFIYLLSFALIMWAVSSEHWAYMLPSRTQIFSNSPSQCLRFPSSFVLSPGMLTWILFLKIFTFARKRTNAVDILHRIPFRQIDGTLPRGNNKSKQHTFPQSGSTRRVSLPAACSHQSRGFCMRRAWNVTDAFRTNRHVVQFI